MGHPEFGLEVIDDKGTMKIPTGTPIFNAISKAPRINSSTNKLFLLEEYELVYGIYNHSILDPTRPLALIAMHPNESACEGSMLYNRIEQFAEFEVGKFFNCSINEFFEFPTDVCDKILETCRKMKNTESTIASSLSEQLQQQISKGK